jgi:Caspase domain
MSKLFESGYALLAGAGGDLPNTVDDALGLAKIFQDVGRCAYPPAQMSVLTGAQARRGDILDALDRLAKTGAQDTVVVYFSGHGYRVSHPALGGQYYLMPYGYDVENLPDTAISGHELAEKLAAIPVQKLLVLLDCCHAGGVGEAKAAGLQFAKAPLPEEVLPLLQAGRGRVLIASSKDDELSYAGKPYSAFTLALIEALCGEGVSKKDGYVRVADLALHTRQMVPRRTMDKQHPVLHFEAADNYVVAYYAGGETQPKGLPFDVEPEIEPEPGAWRAQKVDTSGGPYFGGSFNGTYVGRDQNITIKSEDRSIHVSGPVSNSDLISGDRNQVEMSAAGTVPEFIELLARMTAILPQAGLPAEELQEVQEDLNRVEDQARKQEPNRNILLKRLDALVNFLANSATIAVAAPQLVEMGRQALEWAQRLFR